MEPESPAQSPPIDDLGPPSDRRKLLIIVAGVSIFIIIIVAIVVFSTSRQDSQGSISKGNLPSPTKSLSSQVQASPAVVAKAFYDWYVNHPSPLTSGAYKTRSDISDEYKLVIARYVGRGLPTDRDPVFNCGDFPLPNNVIALAPEYNDNQNQALVILQQEQAERNLYEIKLSKAGNAWLVRDVWCAPSGAEPL